MKNSILVFLLFSALSGCAFVHKMDIEQGNIMTQDDINKLHTGMTRAEVTQIMGTPVLVNIFSPDRVEYIYTLKEGHRKMAEKRVTVIFKHNIVWEVR